jgi:hypothetical protein
LGLSEISVYNVPKSGRFSLCFENLLVKCEKQICNNYGTSNTSTKRRSTMPKKAVDAAKLIKLIEDETPLADILKKMGFKSSTQLKTAYMSALIAEGKVTAIKGGRRGGAKTQKAKTVGVGKRGSIVISKELVDGLGVSGGERFTVRKTKAGIALKRVAE